MPTGIHNKVSLVSYFHYKGTTQQHAWIFLYLSVWVGKGKCLCALFCSRLLVQWLVCTHCWWFMSLGWLIFMAAHNQKIRHVNMQKMIKSAAHHASEKKQQEARYMATEWIVCLFPNKMLSWVTLFIVIVQMMCVQP